MFNQLQKCVISFSSSLFTLIEIVQVVDSVGRTVVTFLGEQRDSVDERFVTQVSTESRDCDLNSLYLSLKVSQRTIQWHSFPFWQHGRKLSRNRKLCTLVPYQFRNTFYSLSWLNLICWLCSESRNGSWLCNIYSFFAVHEHEYNEKFNEWRLTVALNSNRFLVPYQQSETLMSENFILQILMITVAQSTATVTVTTTL